MSQNSDRSSSSEYMPAVERLEEKLLRDRRHGLPLVVGRGWWLMTMRACLVAFGAGLFGRRLANPGHDPLCWLMLGWFWIMALLGVLVHHVQTVTVEGGERRGNSGQERMREHLQGIRSGIYLGAAPGERLTSLSVLLVAIVEIALLAAVVME